MKDMKQPKRLLLALAASAMLANASAARAEEPRPAASFVWPRLIIYVGFSAFGGVGGYDTYGRELARHIGKYLPGNPTATVENKPGAGSLTLMNYIYNQAAHDGTEIGLVASGNVMDPLLLGHRSNARFDPVKFNWIGSMNQETAVFAAMQSPPVTLQDVLGGKTVSVGSTGAGSDNFIYAQLMQSLLHTHLNIIPAYPGMNEIEMAMNNGEITGVTGVSWDSLRVDKAEWLSSGRTNLLMQYALKRSPDLPDVPLFSELVSDPSGKQVINMVLSRQAMGRPFVTHPGVPAERLAALRAAFASAMRDPQLIAECAKMNLVIHWTTGEEVAQVVRGIVATPPDIIDKAQAIFAQ